MLTSWLLLIGGGCLLRLILPFVFKYAKVYLSLWGVKGPRNYFLGSLGNVREMTNRHKTVDVVHKWVQKFGGICKLGSFPIPVVILSSPEYVSKLFSSKQIEHMSKPFIYNLFRPLILDGLLTSSGDKWRAHRTPMSVINSFRNIQSYMGIFNKESHRLVSELEKFSEKMNGRGAPSLEFFSKFCLFSASETLFGKSLEEEDPQIVGELIDSMNSFKPTVHERIDKPWLVFNEIFRLFPLSRKVDKLTSKVHEYWKGVIEEFKRDVDNRSGLPLVKELMDFSEEGLHEEVVTMTVASFHNSGLTVQYLLFFLALHPHHQEVCRKEIDQLLDNPEKCPDGEITQQHISCLKHLERCFMETVRFFPVVYGAMRGLDAPLKLDEDLTLLPGTLCVVFPRELHMLPEHFPNPEKFDPSRFLPEVSQKRHPYAYIPFTGGQRKCIGFKYSTLQVVVACARILRNFVVTTTDKFEDIKIVFGLTISTEPEVSFKFTKRSRS